VREGPQYKIGEFEIVENRRFSTEDLARYYPFNGEGPTLTERVVGLTRGRLRGPDQDRFDQARWDEATEAVRTAYSNEGYIYARVTPVIERTKVGADSQPAVNLRWQIEERTPAVINRIDIAGNDYTTEECIRRQLVLVPGDVFNRDRLLRSWQSVGNLGFFDTPLPFPDTRPANEQGDLDVTFRVKEKRTGSFNFGASMGGAGVGVGGFIGVDQPNLFGLCKRGSLNWNFGRFFNDFQLTYSDPAIRKSRISGTVSAYRRQSRFFVQGFGQNVTTGSTLRVGLPVPGSYFSTLGLSYTADAITLRDVDPTVFGVGNCTSNCFRSNLGVDLTHDTRIGLPFASAGGDGGLQRRPPRRYDGVPALHGRLQVVRHDRPVRRRRAGLAAQAVRARPDGTRRRTLRIAGCLLPAAGLHPGWRAVRPAAARLSGVLDHPARLRSGRRPGERDLGPECVRQRVLLDDRRVGIAAESAVLHERLLRRG
jgi:outer membrane protein insertion porin family